MPAPDTAYVLRLWAAVVLLSLLEAWAFPGDVRGAPGALYVAANVLVFFAALLLLAHEAGRQDPRPALLPAAVYVVLLVAPKTPNATPTHTTHATPARAELTHLFVHLLCAAYLRTACWFEARALLEPVTPVRVRAQHAYRADHTRI
jgi:hypothetical protein